MAFTKVSLARGVSVLAAGLVGALVLPPGHVAPVGLVIFEENFIEF